MFHMRTFLMFLWLVALDCGLSTFTYKEHLKANFEKTFHQKCDKYPFVQRWVDRLDYTDERYVTFVYQEPGFRNGGLGDRMGGLISAVAMAVRFNRTLLLRNGNELGKLFRPYHPTDIRSESPKYNWSSYAWSNFDPKYQNNDATEYDIYDCINNVGSRNRHCSVSDGDVTQPHILYRSNRAYLCYYDNQPLSVGGEQMIALGVNRTSDLFEVGGCMLRLALWPTDYLWDEVSSIYQKFEDALHFDTPRTRTSRRRLRISRNQRNSNSNNISQRTLDDEQQQLQSSAATADHVAAAPFYQVGLHFRCGDRSFLGRAGDQCQYDPVNRASDPGMATGNPMGIAQCAKDTARNYSASLLRHHTSVDGEGSVVADRERERSDKHSKVDPVKRQATLRGLDSDSSSLTPVTSQDSPQVGMRRFEMGFITSDNVASADQMKQVLGMPYTLISPQGCHIEMDSSVACHVFTVSYWFVLSLSDVLVTQTLGEQHTSGPTSSFSRYAGIYGLKDNPFRDGRHCEEFTSNMQLGRMQQSNWFC